ncbi:MAG: hypothetical protein FWE16_02270 [Firmicutes bacterium]|nr:hypothetical protein [Bacillota bacterium]
MDNMKLIILKDDRFKKVLDGSMSVWLTLNDDFAKSIEIDEVLRVLNDNTNETCYIRCVGFHVYSSFEELYNKVDKNTLGYDGTDKENIALIKDQMFCQCSPEQEKKYGVRGIIFEYNPEYKTIAEMTEEEGQAFLKKIFSTLKKEQNTLYRAMQKADETAHGLTELVKVSPPFYFASTDEANNDNLKHELNYTIGKLQDLLDTIQDWENKLKFPTSKKY